MDKKIVLIDGHSILNRAFYGLPDLTDSHGRHTNAVYGFLNILFKILEEEKPQYLAVAFDLPAPTFRHRMFSEYKGTRKPAPQEFREQVPMMKEVLEAMEVPILQLEGYEADDILGTVAKKGEEEGVAVTIVSGDRDLLQLATNQTLIRIPKTKSGKTTIEDYHEKEVLEKYMVTPKQIIELKALMGDTSDNIPGVPSIGEKTATKIICEFGCIETAYEHVEEIKPNRAKESLKENYDKAQLSKILATIDREVPIEFSWEAAKLGSLYTKNAFELFKELQFKNLLNRFENQETQNSVEESFSMIEDLSEAEQIFEKAFEKEQIGLQILKDSKLFGLSLCIGKKECYFFVQQGFLTEEYLYGKIQSLTEKVKRVITMDVKQLLHCVPEARRESLLDFSIAAYLLNPLKSVYTYDDIAGEYLNLSLPSKEEIAGKDKFEKLYETNLEALEKIGCFMSYVCFVGMKKLEQQLEEQQMLLLYQEIEMPLLFVLYEMENYGIKAKAESLKEYSNKLSIRIDELEKTIYEQAGEEFNINSPKQLGVILFEKLGIKGGKKTKTGYSTAADILEKLSADYPIVSDILEYRQYTKLKSTYAQGLANYIQEDGRIHSTFNQTITATGRISSTEPNLQNIPIRMELGRMIRKVFIPEDGYIFLDADYSQIELRVLAHLSQDEKLIDAYNHAEDIHRLTASEVFHTPFDEVTDLQRRNAKAVNFGIVYGISSFGLSQDLSISNKEAAQYIKQYFETYPKIKGFLDHLVEQAKEKGYVTTMFHRRRPIPELKSSNFMQRAFGERIAMNSPIQGTAADIIKIAMIRVSEQLKEKNLKSRLILQVHDELLIEVFESEMEVVLEILKTQMQNAADLAVSLEVDVHQGKTWYEAK